MAEWIKEPWFYEFDPIEVTPAGTEGPLVAVPVLFSGFPSLDEAGFGLRFKTFEQVEYPSEAFFVGKNLYSCALISPQDLLGFWRACLLVRHCKNVDPWLIQHCLTQVTMRGRKHRSSAADLATIVEMVEGGQATIDAIMQTPPPEWLLAKIVELWSLKGSSPWTHALTEERRAGLIEWREEFDEIGALTPEEHDRREALWERLWPAYLPIMQGIAKAAKMDLGNPIDRSTAIRQFRDELITLSDAGAEDEHGVYVTAALAFLAGNRTSMDIMDVTLRTFPGEFNPLDLARDFDRLEQKHVKLIAPWVARRVRAGAAFNPQQIVDMQARLTSALAHHFPRPTTESLTRELLKDRYHVDLSPTSPPTG